GHQILPDRGCHGPRRFDCRPVAVGRRNERDGGTKFLGGIADDHAPGDPPICARFRPSSTGPHFGNTLPLPPHSFLGPVAVSALPGRFRTLPLGSVDVGCSRPQSSIPNGKVVPKWEGGIPFRPLSAKGGDKGLCELGSLPRVPSQQLWLRPVRRL